MTKQRLVHIDIAKAFAILLVIMGHTSYIPEEERIVIYSFHMPLFFLLSGMFIGNELKIVRRIKTLILPFIFFNILYILVNRIGKPLTPQPFIKIFYFTRGSSGLWFLPCLFCAQFIMSCFYKILTISNSTFLKIVYHAILVILIGIGIVYNMLIGKPLPLSLDISLIILPFLYLGRFIKNYDFNNFYSFIIAISFFLFFLYLEFKWLGHRTDLYDSNIGNFPLFYLSGICGSFITIGLSRWLSSHISKCLPILCFIGSNTLVIYCLHKLAIKFWTKLFAILPGFDISALKIFYSFIQSILCIAVLIPFILFINKKMTWMLGRF